ncbi:hypothetical protein DPMN_019090 [Dreissena polymorpha]|uniref:Uncharacterized protein n=1 Tax=Dreissena polymorpha TaxID=45954 RepID=A0A9D4S8Y7_DREPO|nr:hypothetical protein DPMN_162343 [Dreissena polymorpha]KAH3894930.1 hypothetical protein DPMN_019090 [Dreissena polymorpha]
MLRISCRTELFNDADFLRQEVNGEELEVKGGEVSFWTGAPAVINAGALLKTTTTQWVIGTCNKLFYNL